MTLLNDLLVALEQIQQRAVLGGRESTEIEVIARNALIKAGMSDIEYDEKGLR